MKKNLFGGLTSRLISGYSSPQNKPGCLTYLQVQRLIRLEGSKTIKPTIANQLATPFLIPEASVEQEKDFIEDDGKSFFLLKDNENSIREKLHQEEKNVYYIVTGKSPKDTELFDYYKPDKSIAKVFKDIFRLIENLKIDPKEENDVEVDNSIEMRKSAVMRRIRRMKMNRHKYKKRLKRTRATRRKVKAVKEVLKMEREKKREQLIALKKRRRREMVENGHSDIPPFRKPYDRYKNVTEAGMIKIRASRERRAQELALRKKAPEPEEEIPYQED